MNRYFPHLILASALGIASLSAQTGPDLVLDINAANTGLPSYPRATTRAKPLPGDSMVVLNGKAYFTAVHDIHGRELFVTNGKAAGTKIVKDIRPGSSDPQISELTMSGGKLFFGANDGTNGFELWVSDGTSSGTFMVRDHEPGSRGGNINGITPYKNGVAYIASHLNPTTRTWAFELMESDGTAAGTKRIRALGTDRSRRQVGYVLGSNAAKSKVYYISTPHSTQNRNVFAIDSFTMTALVGGNGWGARDLVPFGQNQVFFVAGSGPTQEIYISGGTVASTRRVKAGLSGDLANASVFQGKLWFSGNQNFNTGFFVTDGTANNTVRLVGPFRGATRPVELNNKVYFTDGSKLYESGGTLATTRVAWSKPTVRGIHALFQTGSAIYFTAADLRQGQELWFTNGTAPGTRLVRDIRPEQHRGSIVLPYFTELAGRVIFAADDGKHGFELWETNGLASGTRMVKDIRGATATKPSDPDWFVEMNRKVYFSADDGIHGRELWVSDGTASGTKMVRDVYVGANGSNPQHLVRLGDKILFSAIDRRLGIELFSSDGTSGGTRLLFDIRSGGSSSPMWMTRIGDRVFFSADDGQNGRELWITDGTVAGTKMIRNINSTLGSDPRYFAELGYSGRCVFAASQSTNDPELWISDGTLAGTQMIRFQNGFRSLAPRHMTRIGNGKVVFGAADATGDRELWITDGTTQGTFELKNLNASGSSDPHSFSAWDEPGGAVFIATVQQPRIFSTNGTTSGTNAVQTFGHQPKYVTISGNRDIYFSGISTNVGRELWKTNGPALTTRLLKDVRPGTRGSDPEGQGEGGRAVFADSDGRVYMSADDGQRGRELYVVTTRAWHKQVGRPCGHSGTKATLHTTSPVVPSLWQWNGRNAPTGWFAVNVLSAPPQTLLGGCGLHIDFGSMIHIGGFPVTTASWSFGVPIPNNVSLIGARYVVQTGYVRPNPTTFDWSNAVLGVVGS